jgi:hypothetical protein
MDAFEPRHEHGTPDNPLNLEHGAVFRCWVTETKQLSAGHEHQPPGGEDGNDAAALFKLERKPPSDTLQFSVRKIKEMETHRFPL